MKLSPLPPRILDSRIAITVAGLSPELREEWEERAAIVEHCGGYERGEAERLALVMVLQARAKFTQ